MNKIESLKIKIFADGADLKSIELALNNPIIKGFTTNPTLMRKAGIANYKIFAKSVLELVTRLSVSFEVIADDLVEMERQSLEIASWGNNVLVKMPITTTSGISTLPLVNKLSGQGVKFNITAIMNEKQAIDAFHSIPENKSAVLSIFAGRIADTGIDPEPIVKSAVEQAKKNPNIEILWASPREIFNIFQAERIGCHIITVTDDLLKKASGIGKDLNQLSLETVQMFYQDAQAAKYCI